MQAYMTQPRKRLLNYLHQHADGLGARKAHPLAAVLIFWFHWFSFFGLWFFYPG